MPFLAFFTGGIGRWLVLALIVAASLAFIRQHLINIGRQQVLAENERAAVKIVKKQGEATERVLTKYVRVAGKTETVTKTIEKEVIRYESAKLDTCPVSVGFRVLHDSAAANTVPDPARATDGSPAGITAAEALGTVTGNYSRFHETADRLRSLQEWIREQQKVAR